MKIVEHLWNPWKCMGYICFCLFAVIVTCASHHFLMSSVLSHENLWKILKIRENQWKSMSIYENTWNPWKWVGYICFQKKKMGYILYSKNMNASNICLPERNKLSERRKWKSWFSGKHTLWHVKRMSKWHFSWKPEMIPRSLRTFCPKRFPLEPS